MSGPEPPRFPVRDEPADPGERREGSSDDTGTPADATDAPTNTPAGDRGAKDSPESRPPPPTRPAPSSGDTRPTSVPPSQREGIGERRPSPERPDESRPTTRGGEDRPASWRPTQSRPWEPRSDPSAGEARPAAPGGVRPEEAQPKDTPKDPPKDGPADGPRPGAAPASPPRSDFSVRRDLSSRPGLDPTTRERGPDPAAGEPRRDGGNLRPEPPAERPPGGPTTTSPPRPDPFRRPGSGDRPGDGVAGAGSGATPGGSARSAEASTAAPSTARPATDVPTTRPGERPSEREGTGRPGTDPAPFRTAWKPTERPGASRDRGGPATMPLPGTTDRPPERPERPQATTATEAVREKLAEPTTPERPVEREPEGTRAHVVTPVPPTGRMTRVAKIPVGAAFRIAVVVYLLVVVLWLILGSVLFLLLQNTGVVENIESFYGELLGYEDVQFQFSAAFLFSAVAGLVWVLVASLGSAFMAFVYNRASRLVGGLKVVVDDEHEPGH